MDILNKAINTYKQEGSTTLFKQAITHIRNQISPKPAVTDGSRPLPFWYLKYLYNFMFEIKHDSGFDVMSEDWDTLILLDACRFDDFKESNNIEGELGFRISPSVDSPGYIRENFLGRELADTVYVTANPHAHLVKQGVFCDVIVDPIKQWDPETGCVRPNTVTEAAIKTHQRYPQKRVIVHYMQPHDPPLGPTARKLRKKVEIGGQFSDEDQSNKQRIMQLVAKDKISEKTAHKAYKETLEIVLGEVATLLEEINGKVVVSADHGEMFGEKPYRTFGKLYEHYQNPKTVQLCKVPWLAVEENSDRRKISMGRDTKRTKNLSQNEIETQLEALGYKE